jgi:hypothetical protein
MDRMPVRRLIAAVFLAALLALPASASAAVQARQADAFVDSIGVGVHTAYNDTPYASGFATVVQRLQELGVRHVRDDLFPNRADQYARLDALAAAGIGSTLILGSPANGAGGLEDLLAEAADLDGVEALEGPNEYSTMGGDPDWVAHLRAYQQQLYEDAKANPDLAGLPVIGPSIVHGDQDELGDVSDFLDLGNIHSYPQGGPPPNKLGSAIDRAETFNSGTKPIVATETGYHNALAWPGENRPVPEDVSATYMPRLFLEYWRWGIARTFSYELLDEFANPELDEAESHFGLLRTDLSRKPAFEALRNTIAILGDPGATFAPGALDYALSEAGAPLGAPESPGLHKVLLQKRDGSFYLALWRTTSVWDPASDVPIAAPPSPVEVTVAPSLAAAAEYRPNGSADPVWSATQPSQPLTVAVGPAVTVLRLVPGPPAGQPDPEPETQPTSQQGRIEVPVADPDDQVTEPRPCVVPSLKGRTAGGSREALKRRGCRLGAISGERGRASRVVRQRPRAGRVLPPGGAVDVKLLGPRLHPGGR